ncbi:hypothetical protein IV102_13950 [bacterium]|nr:hypothetical protein [bacterium]
MLEDALIQLARCGIRLRPEVQVADVTVSETYLPGLSLPARLLMRLGQPAERPPYPPLSDAVLRQDAECVCRVDTYLRMAERLRKLAGDSLPLEQIDSEVDFQAKTAWVSFLLDGQETRWELEYNEDWMDPCFFSNFSQRMVRRGASAQLLRPKLRTGQEIVLVCLSPDQKAALEELTGLHFMSLL